MTHPQSTSEAHESQPPGSLWAGRLNRITRNRWRIAFLWVVISGPLAYLIDRYIEPTYLAYGLIKVESYPDLFGTSQGRDEADSKLDYLQTEIETIRSNPVLALALMDPSLAKCAAIKDSHDPRTELRGRLDLRILEKTHFIRVAYEASSPEEARDAVNIVIRAYAAYLAADESDGRTNSGKFISVRNKFEGARRDLARYTDGLKQRIEGLRNRLRELAKADDALAAKAGQSGELDRGTARRQDGGVWNSHVNQVDASFVRDDLERGYSAYRVASRKLEQLEFALPKTGPFIERVDEAELPKSPHSDHRITYMAVAPVGVLFALLAVFLAFGQDQPRRRPGAEAASEV